MAVFILRKDNFFYPKYDVIWGLGDKNDEKLVT